MCHKALALTLAFCSILYLAELQENAGKVIAYTHKTRLFKYLSVAAVR